MKNKYRTTRFKIFLFPLQTDRKGKKKEEKNKKGNLVKTIKHLPVKLSTGNTFS